MSTGAVDSGRAPSSVRACDAIVVAFGAWTLAAHACVFAGASFDAMLVTAAVLVPLALFGVGRLRAGPAAPAGPAPRRWPARAAGAALASAAVVVALAAGTGRIELAWAAAALSFGATFALSARAGGDAPFPAPARSAGSERVVWILALIGAAIPLVLQRPDLDDGYYVNVAVTVADDPSAPLLAVDGLFGVDGLPVLLAVYRFHSYELLSGALARLTPLEAIQAAHWVVPPVFALLVTLALARAARLLTPRTWVWTLAAAWLLLAVVAETHRWYGNFAFVRIHQGKAVLASAYVPLLVAYAAELARRPSPRAVALVLLAQVGAVGLNATAIWAAPLTVGFTLVALVPWSRAGLGRLALGVAPSLYLVALGLWVKAEMQTRIAGIPLGDEIPDSGAAYLQDAWETTVGDAWLAGVVLFAWVAGQGLVRGLGRRWYAGFSLAFLLVLFDPFLATLVAENLTGEMTYFRALWVLPLPLLVACALTAPMRAVASPRAAAAATAALFAATLALTSTFTWSADNDARVDPFGLKVQPEEYAAARALVEAAAPAGAVCAPEEVSILVGTFHAHPHAVNPRSVYVSMNRDVLTDEDRRRRITMSMMLAADRTDRRLPGPQTKYFLRSLEHFDVEALCLPAGSASIRDAITDAGWQRTEAVGPYEIWRR